MNYVEWFNIWYQLRSLSLRLSGIGGCKAMREERNYVLLVTPSESGLARLDRVVI
jgi:hypothetical protein